MSATQVPDHYQSHGHAVVVTAIVSPIVAAFFIGLRLYTRAFLAHALGWDDYVAFLALATSIAFSVLISLATQHGLGMHQYDMTSELEQDYYKWVLISSPLYLLSLLLYKLAILLCYLRIFGVSQRFRQFTYGVIFFTTGYLGANILTQIFGCHPIRKFWAPDSQGTCIVFVAADIAYGAMNVASDLLIALLPMPMVWRLRMTRREKVGVSLIFLSGLVAFVVALVRWVYALLDLHSSDRVYLAGLNWLWSVLEINTGVICGCTFTLKPLFRRVQGYRLLSWTGYGRSRSGQSHGTAAAGTTASAAEKRREVMGRWLGGGRERAAERDESPLGSMGTTVYGTDDEETRLGKKTNEENVV